MRYLAAFAAAALLAAPALLGVGLALSPAPIAAEYWVRQATAIKADIARKHRGERKGFVVGGSSALFAIDTRTLTGELGVPFVNVATHVHLPLAAQLDNVAPLAERGDAVILALEPHYYCPPEDNPWYVRNAIAWRREAWQAMPIAERAQGLWKAGPWLLVELAAARLAAMVAPWTIADRLDALDDAATLRRFAATPPAREFGYTLANLDALGNIRGTEGTHRLRQEGFSSDTELLLCPGARAILDDFVRRERVAGVLVRFAYSPFMESSQGAEVVAARARAFESDLARVAPLLEPRPQVTFARGLFFDTGLHLNAEGRARRTATLARAIRADAELTSALMAKPGRSP